MSFNYASLLRYIKINGQVQGYARKCVYMCVEEVRINIEKDKAHDNKLS